MRAHELRHSVLLPIKDVWTKNFYTNLFAACSAPSVREVLITTKFLRSPRMPLKRPVLELPSSSRHDMWNAYAAADVVLNASLTECHPMTSLESIAMGVPCVTGPVVLPPLEEHPYLTISRVYAVDTVSCVQDVLETMMAELERDPKGLGELVKDYKQQLLDEALRRHAELCRL
jgi:glycosyltransferase involved in cell wall biosynthesis